MKEIWWALIFGFLALSLQAFAQVQEAELSLDSHASTARWGLDIPLLESPGNLPGLGYAPTMNQSLQISTDYYLYLHDQLAKIPSQGYDLSRIAIFSFDLLSLYMPLGNAWLHEEWHRAVMARRGMSSHNDVYNFKLGASTIAVSQVTDKELAKLKRDHPAEFVRMSSAGMEAESEQVYLIEQKLFAKNIQKNDRSTFNEHMLLWMNQLQNMFYLWTCGTHSADVDTDKMNDEDGTDVGKRDFTGLDCNAWTYDLFRPQEAYGARGAHPSGVGINRYIKASQMTDDERNYLSRQKALTLLNFVDPFLFGQMYFSGVLWEDEVRWNWNLRHLLTSFGTSTDLNIFLNHDSSNYYLRMHAYANKKSVWPGLEIEDARILNMPTQWRSRLAIWWQPKEQSFYASQPEFGGLWGIRRDHELTKNWDWYTSLTLKSRGWVAGIEDLEPAAMVDLGLTYYL